MGDQIVKRRRGQVVVAAAVAGILLIGPAADVLAAPATFDGDAAVGTPGDNVTWTNATNWTTDGVADVAPAAAAPGDDLTFGGGTAGAVIDLGGPQFANTLTFTRNYTLGLLPTTTNVLTVATAPVTVGSGVTGTINAVYAGAAAAGTTGLALTGGGTLVLNRATGNTFTGNITVDGAGTTLAFVGSNSSLDPTSLGAGAKSVTLTNGGTASLVAGTLSNPTGGSKSFVIGAGGGTLDIQAGQTLQLDDSGQFGGTGALTKTGGGVLLLSNQAFGFTGPTITINAGTIRATANGGVLGAGNISITVAGGAALDVQATLAGTKPITVGGAGVGGAGALLAGTGTGVANGAVTLTADTSLGGNGTLTLSGVVTDGASTFNVNKVGTGVLALTAANTIDGTFTVSAGALRAASGTGLPNTSNLNLAGGVFETTAATFTRALGTGPGQVQVTGGASGFSSQVAAAVVNLGGAGAAVQFGSTNFNPASLVLNAGSANNPLTFTNPLDLNGAVRTITVNAAAANTATLAGALTNSAGTPAGLTKAGTGVLVLGSAANSYTDPTTVTGGALRGTLGTNVPAASNLVLNGGVFETGANVAATLGTAGGEVQLPGGTGSGFSAFGAPVTVTLNGGAALQWGAATFNPTTLLLNATSANNALTLANPLDLNGAVRTVTVNAAAANAATLTGAVTSGTGTAGLTKTGSGVLVLGNTANSYNGTTLVSGGALRGTLGSSLPATSNLSLNGGVFETATNVTATLGTGPGEVQLPGGASGFSAFGAPITVALNGGAALQWGTATFNPSTLVLNAASSNNTVDFQNGINLNGATRTFGGGNATSVGTVSGVIANGTGTAGPTINGAGVVAFTAANTYNGPTVLTAGTLSVGADANLGLPTAGVNFNGGTLRVTGTTLQNFGSRPVAYVVPNPAAVRTVGLDIADAANTFTTPATPAFAAGTSGQTLTKSGAGTLALGATTNALNQLNINGGTLEIGAGTLTVNNSAGAGGNAVVGGGNATINATGGGTLVITGQSATAFADNSAANGTTLTINARVTSAFGFEYFGTNAAGTIVLANPANDFTGVAINSAGTISVAAIGPASATAGPLGRGSAPISLNATAGARLLYTGPGETTDRAVALNNSGTLDASGTGLLRFTANVAAPGGNVKTLTLQGTGAGELAGAIGQNSGTNTTSVLKAGTGTWTLSGTNTFTGAVTVNVGSLVATNSGALGVGPKTITIIPTANPASLPSLRLDGTAGNITLPANLSFSTSYDALLNGVPIPNAGAVVNVAGSNTIAGNFSLTGGGGGTALVANAGSALTATGNFAIATGQSARNLVLRGDGTGTVAGVISNGASTLGLFRDFGAGSWSLTAANTYTGGTTVTAGTLLANNATGSATGTGAVTVSGTGTLGGSGTVGGAVTVNAGGSINPGNSPGTLSIAGPLTFGNTGTGAAPTYLAELLPSAAPVAGTDNDLIALTGTGAAGLLTLSNPDRLNLSIASDLAGPATYTIATFASRVGEFNSVVVNGFVPTQNTDPNGPNYALLTYNPTNIQLSVANLTAVPEPMAAGLVGAAGLGLLARRRRAARVR